MSPEQEATLRIEVPDGLTVGGARRLGRAMLAGVSTTPALDADVLVEHAAGVDRVGQITRADAPLDGVASTRLLDALRRRAAGEPVAYITGRKAFRTVELRVDPRVLVPRPETELLVEIGLKALSRMAGDLRLIDVGTGSGAVALALATELPAGLSARVAVVASDISQNALHVAAANRAELGLAGRVKLLQADLLDGIDGEFDVILANLPYLRSDQRDPSTAREPESALYAGADGLEQYRRLWPQAAARLAAGGLIACELDPGQADEMERLAERHIGGEAATLVDLAGRERFVIAGAVDIVRTVVDTWPYGA